MRAALIDNNGAVVNVIVADPSRDNAPGKAAGFRLIKVPDGVPVDSNRVYSASKGFTDPRPPEVITPAE